MRFSDSSSRRRSTESIGRMFHVLRNYGISKGRMEKNLRELDMALSSGGYKATLPVCAVVLRRYPDTFRSLKHCELACHGYRHTDVSDQSPEVRRTSLKRAKEVFESFGKQCRGYRGPYLRMDDDMITTLSQEGFSYDSTRSIFWNVLEGKEMVNLESLLSYYSSLTVDKSLSLPWFEGSLLEIPVSLPDDEILVERLGMSSSSQILSVWSQMLARSYESGEIVVLQAHPERFPIVVDALLSVIKDAESKSPGVWIATLSEINHWWRKRRKFSISIERRGQDYVVEADAGEDGMFLLSSSKRMPHAWFRNYRFIAENKMRFVGRRKPCAGIRPGSSSSLSDFLEREGYYYEESTKPEDFELYLDDQEVGKTREVELSREIEESGAALARIWRWPKSVRSVMSITGDVDALGLFDFFARWLGR